MNNLGIRQAKQQLVAFINGLPFDIEVKRLLIKDIYDDVRDEANRIVSQEATEVQKQLKEAKDVAGMATDSNTKLEE